MYIKEIKYTFKCWSTYIFIIYTAESVVAVTFIVHVNSLNVNNRCKYDITIKRRFLIFYTKPMCVVYKHAYVGDHAIVIYKHQCHIPEYVTPKKILLVVCTTMQCAPKLPRGKIVPKCG